MTDLALLQRWTDRRDAQAFKEIVSRYASMVYMTCTRILRNSADAEDVTQECFEVLAQGRGGPTEHLGAWLHRVATNRALDRIRSEQRRKTREADFVAEQSSRVEPAWNDVYTCVDEAVAELPEELRIPVVAHYLLGESHAEIAGSIGVPRRTVSRRISRGVEMIGESLKKRGVRVASGALAALMAANMAKASAVPPPLMAVLGRLALAQSANAVGATTSSLVPVAKLVGGMLVMKKIAVIVVIVTGALLGFWALKPHGAARNVEPRPVPATATQDKALPERPTEPIRSSKSAEALPAQEKSAVLAGEAATPGISGQVVDAETGEVVPGAKVVAMEGVGAYAGEKQRTEAVSDDKGRFEITGLQAGGYLLMKETGPGDYMVSVVEDMVDVRLKDSERKEGILLRTRKGGMVSGAITNERGSPVAGASVTIDTARNESFQGIKAAYSRVDAGTQTDASGQYTFRGVKVGKGCAIAVHADGYMPIRSPEFSLTGAGASKRVDLRLSRGSTITGWVEDREGNHKPGMELTLEPDYEGRTHLDTIMLMAVGRRVSGAKSDADGRFRLDGLPAGKYHLFAGGIYRSPYGLLGGGTCVEVDGSQGVEDVVVRAYSLGLGEHAIAGHVSSAEGAPIAGAQIDLVVELPSKLYYMHTDENGMFFVDGLAPGKFPLLATAAGYAQSLVFPVPLDEPDLAITLQRNAAIRGRVLELDGGRPLAGATVTIAKHDRPERTLSSDIDYLVDRFDGIRETIVGAERATTDGNGAFELGGIEPGHLRLKAERTGYAASFGDELLIEPGQDVGDAMIFMGRGATVEGVVLSTSREPVGGASILVIESAVAQEGPGGAEGRLVQATNMGEGCRDIRAITDADGTFVVVGLADGDYWMRAIAADYAYSTVTDVSVSGGASQSSVELVLDPGGTVEGRVTQGGLPKQDVAVQACLDGADAAAIRVATDADGHYVIRHVMPGKHMFQAIDWNRPGRSGVINLNVSVVSGQTTQQDFEYSGHVVKGLVSGLETPTEWQVAILRIPEGVDPEAPPDMSIDWPSFVAGMATINADGSYAIENLADGVYKLEVFQFQNDVIVPKGVWKTIAIEGEDLVVDVQSSD